MAGSIIKLEKKDIAETPIKFREETGVKRLTIITAIKKIIMEAITVAIAAP